MEVFDLQVLKGPYAPLEKELMIALQLAMWCVTNPPFDGPSRLLEYNFFVLLKSKSWVYSLPTTGS
jgi:hypothetical protein